jgi:hypothetical protein
VIHLIGKGANPRFLGQTFNLNPTTLQRWVDSQNRGQFREVKVPKIHKNEKIKIETPSGFNISFENIQDAITFVQEYEKGAAAIAIN